MKVLISKTRYKKVCFIGIIVLLLLLLLFMYKFVTTGIRGNYDVKKMNYYKDDNNRINYFRANENEFNEIAKIFEKYTEINKIKYDNVVCSSTEKIVITIDNTHLCVDKSSKNINEIKDTTINKSLKKLSNIVEIEKIPIMNDNADYIYNKLRFFVISSALGTVYYDYCLQPYYCKDDKDIKKEKYRNVIIDNRWSSIYNDN